MIKLDFSRRLRPLAFCAPVFVLAFSLTGCATRATRGTFVPSERVLKWAEDGLGIVDGYFEADVIARRRAIGSKLTAGDREEQDKRLRDWITDRKAKGYQVFGESEFASSDN